MVSLFLHMNEVLFLPGLSFLLVFSFQLNEGATLITEKVVITDRSTFDLSLASDNIVADLDGR